MFKRIVLEDWQNIVPLVSFGVTFAIFFIAVLRAVTMRRENVDRLANLPLDSTTQDNANRTH